jgi:hypothetical protein
MERYSHLMIDLDLKTPIEASAGLQTAAALAASTELATIYP